MSESTSLAVGVMAALGPCEEIPDATACADVAMLISDHDSDTWAGIILALGVIANQALTDAEERGGLARVDVLATLGKSFAEVTP